MDNNGISDLYASIFSGTTGLIALVFYILVAVGLWKVSTKAGYPGILAIIPFVNLVFLVKIAGMSGWFALLYLVPIVNLVLAIIVAFKLGARFGKGGVFSFFLLLLFPYIGYLILGFGDARYSKA
ncbi:MULTISPECIES: DUF5684 domain-containing protein [unclassified Microbacterium]|uniref:DUF5684 domain-containing protein n=1 Tax=unclassified Microbacterium TaxID=2609290 RepID=UPI000CFC4EFB|nr:MULTISPECIES: DUF5684 domain-containing protein [unclassified Microbacterium]PQZ53674.1 hypothetical protein CQ032_14710 [Microbacterium sp. MYb43]PQZ76297.1 hypothetical protein CQ031_13385 [Microbacterium sp. MYb40]PRB21409.1 hypothetical protein CQ040_08575 [Microbacterium sp. MYb54]PRB29974.1 hypothetical protein CQ037_06195 [Microbacterium sp. MYb50]PRB67867.1 hypothetical protein CQ021_07780 [Microbacterium sp. MYb24]